MFLKLTFNGVPLAAEIGEHELRTGRRGEHEPHQPSFNEVCSSTSLLDDDGDAPLEVLTCCVESMVLVCYSSKGVE